MIGMLMNVTVTSMMETLSASASSCFWNKWMRIQKKKEQPCPRNRLTDAAGVPSVNHIQG
jgi:hypothetical protein